jgi:energy-coupling factor transporter ATP-binding protein EcfA2
MTEGQGASALPVPDGAGTVSVPIPEPTGSRAAAGGSAGAGDSGPAQGSAREGGVQPPGAGTAGAHPPGAAGAHAASAHAAGPQEASPQDAGGQEPGARGTGARGTGIRGLGAHVASGRAIVGRGSGARGAGAHAAGAHAAGSRAAGPYSGAPHAGAHAGGPGTDPSAAAGPSAAADPSGAAGSHAAAGRGAAGPGAGAGAAGAGAAGAGAPAAAAPGQGAPGQGAPGQGLGTLRTGVAGRGASQDDLTAVPTEPYVKVDARRLEGALLSLRHPIVTVPLVLETPGVVEARAERRKLLSQIDDYLLPRLRQSGAPILVALVGSTGAGKSTLMNSLVGMQVSQTGIRRPTTNSPVLACHPSDAHWFAENVFLPTLPRVRQQGLATPGRDGLLVLAASEGMPRGVALLDTPDIDSVVQAHNDFAHQFLDASDLWLFMTSARRYADAAVWELLKDARDRDAALAVVLSRVPPSSAPQLAAHFDAMLEANGLSDFQRFLIPETIVTDAKLPTEIARPVREWLEETASGDDRRVAVLTQTMSGVLDTFRTRVPALAEHAATQVTLRRELRESVRGAYDRALAEFDEVTVDGSLLRGEVLTRWQDFAGTGDLMRTLQVRRGRAASPSKKRRPPSRASALRSALRTSLESLVAAISDRAAESAMASLQQHPAGTGLLSELAAAVAAGRSAASDYLALALADLGMAENAADEGGVAPVDAAALAKSSTELAAAARKLVRAWQERVLQLVHAENVTKRSIARVVSFDHESLALVLMIGVLGTPPSRAQASDGEAASAVPASAVPAASPVPASPVPASAGSASAGSASAGPAGTAPAGAMGAGAAAAGDSATGVAAAGAPPASAAAASPKIATGGLADDPGAGPERLLSSLFGAGLLRDITARARLDLHDRVATLFETELARFSAVIDAAGGPDEATAAQLVAASEALEAVR